MRAHNAADIPDQDPRIPRSRSDPSLSTKEAPVNTTGELGMSLHRTKLARASQVGMGAIRASYSSISPELDRHVVGTTDEAIADMRGPSQAANGVLMTAELDHRLARVAEVEGTDDGVDASNSNDSVTVLVPIVGKCLSRLSGGWAGGIEG